MGFLILWSLWSYGNRKSHAIWGSLEAILRVLGLIYGRGVLNTPSATNRVKRPLSVVFSALRRDELIVTNLETKALHSNLFLEIH